MKSSVSERANVIDVPVPSPKKVVSVKLEVELVEEIDRVWRMLGYSSRSEFIREAILYYMQIAIRRLENKNTISQEVDIEEYDELI